MTSAQSDVFIIKEIIIEGNNHTKDYIINKELDFSLNDTISWKNKEVRFNKNEKRLYDTKLFNKVEITSIDLGQNNILINIHLERSWFIFPAPIFEIEAENFTTWWKRYHFASKWINYGLRLTHINLTGNQDKFKIVYQAGFTNKYELEYYRPYVYQSKLGFSLNAYYTTNKSAGYETINNKVIYLESKERIILKRFRLSSSFFYRPSAFVFQEFKTQYHHNIIDDEIANDLNPDYFLNGKSQIKFFLLEYYFKLDHRIFKLYPEGGYLFAATIKKEGIGAFNDINLFNIKINLEKYHTTSWGLILQTGIEFKKEIIKAKAPYSNYSAIGYGNDFVRGYEPYIMDGSDYFIFRNSVRKEIWSKEKNLGRYMPLRPFKKMFVELYFRINMEMAYVNDPYYQDTNDLNNQLLIGFGSAVDLILYHNYLFSVEYNINKLGEHSLYLHNHIGF